VKGVSKCVHLGSSYSGLAGDLSRLAMVKCECDSSGEDVLGGSRLYDELSDPEPELDGMALTCEWGCYLQKLGRLLTLRRR
jgi:hypothetical protein